MKKLLITAFVLISSAASFAKAANLPGPQNGATQKHTVGGVEFGSTASRPTPLVIVVTEFKKTHTDGDFSAYDSSRKLRFQLVVGRTGAELRYLNSDGIKMIEQDVSLELGSHFLRNLAGTTESCPSAISIDRSKMQVTAVDSKCDLY